jgi:uncharacterized membrane protein YvbJ
MLRVYEEADVITCPNCGTQNEPGAHFCAECGANLGSLTSTSNAPQPGATAQPVSSGRPVWIPGQGWVTGAHAPVEIVHQEQPKQRSWLWVVLMAIALLIVLCCVSSLYFSTDRGTDQLNRLGTWSAEHK